MGDGQHGVHHGLAGGQQHFGLIAHSLAHQGVAYGMCAELFADPTTGAGVGVMTSGTRLNRDTSPLMRVGFDLLTLGFASLRGAD